MTLSSITTGLVNIAKGAFFPAAFVAAGKGIPAFNQTHTTSLETLKQFGESLATTANTAIGKATNFKPHELPKLVQAIPTHAKDSWETNSTQMTTAAVWGGTAVLANEVLKRTPGIKNQTKFRAVVSVLVGAGAAFAACEFGLGKVPNPHMFVDTAIKVATLAIPYVAVNIAADTAFGLTGASSSVLATVITKTCRSGQSLLRALSFPGTPQLIDVPGAGNAISANQGAMNAQALGMLAHLTAAKYAHLSQVDLTDHILQAHPGIAPLLATAIAAHAKAYALQEQEAAADALRTPRRKSRKAEAPASAPAARRRSRTSELGAGASATAATPPEEATDTAAGSGSGSGSGGELAALDSDE